MIDLDWRPTKLRRPADLAGTDRGRGAQSRPGPGQRDCSRGSCDPPLPDQAFRGCGRVRASGIYEVVTPEEAPRLLVERDGANFRPLVGGLDPEVGRESLHLLESEVLPRVR